MILKRDSSFTVHRCTVNIMRHEFVSYLRLFYTIINNYFNVQSKKYFMF
jgi:hypothetical protein